ncbi:MAG TPA: glycosyltransferase [Dermatophilaceae bacterium]|nr:glycosyltransferase [Dermatophilaceae bacterium]
MNLLFYCQHSLGLGHLARSLRLAAALAERFEVTLLNGGRLPAGTVVPPGVTLVNLPPLGHDDRYQLVSHDPLLSVEQACQARRERVLATLASTAPAAVVIELYPFGRKKFEFELIPLLDAAHARADRPVIVCSLRDLLVRSNDQARSDERRSRLVNTFFDAVLVHADPRFARLEESFRPQTPLRVPVLYTGFVAPEALGDTGDATTERLPRVLVSSGGGMVGEPLVRAAVAAHAEVARRSGLATTVVAGPFLPEPVWTWLQEQAARFPALSAIRSVPDLRAAIARSAVSVSQAGYNTTMDLLRTRTPAVLVPYGDGDEDEQLRRAQRLAALGVAELLPPGELDGSRLADVVVAAAGRPPQPTAFDLSGASTTASLVAGLVRALLAKPAVAGNLR